MGYMASTWVSAARNAVVASAEKASVAAAKATAAALQGEQAQVVAQQAGAKQLANQMGFPLKPVSIPTAAAYGDQPIAGPPYPMNAWQEPGHLQTTHMSMPPLIAAAA